MLKELLGEEKKRKSKSQMQVKMLKIAKKEVIEVQVDTMKIIISMITSQSRKLRNVVAKIIMMTSMIISNRKK